MISDLEGAIRGDSFYEEIEEAMDETEEAYEKCKIVTGIIWQPERIVAR